jgi:hypothetical protein
VHKNQADEGLPMCAAECMGVFGILADTRCYRSQHGQAALALQTKSPTLPAVNRFGGGGFVMHPIFVNTTNTTYNATFVRGYAVHDCPAGACYDEKTGMRYWGMVEIAFPAASPSHRPFLQR